MKRLVEVLYVNTLRAPLLASPFYGAVLILES